MVETGDTDDSGLMLAFGKGDDSAFEKLAERHRRGLVNFFFRMCRSNQEQAEDLAQDVLLRVYLHRKHYRPVAKFTTYLYRIARNCWIDFLRKNKKRAKDRSLDVELTEDGGSLAEIIPDSRDTPEETTSKKDYVEAVIKAIDSLPEEHRVVFVLSHVRDMKYPQIARVLGVPVGTVKSRMFNALKKLREKLGTMTAMEMYKKDSP